MSKCVFFDSDILIDVFSQRQPFYNQSARCLELAEQKKFQAYTSPLVIANVFYVLQKYSNKKTAIDCIKNIRQFINVVNVDQICIDQALNSDFTDFEDALQYFSALSGGCNVLLTRNGRHYRQASISIFTAETYLRRER